MRLHEVLEQVGLSVPSTTNGTFRQASREDVEYRVARKHAIGVSYCMVEYRYFPHHKYEGQWSDWGLHDGFDMDEVLAEDWEVFE